MDAPSETVLAAAFAEHAPRLRAIAKRQLGDADPNVDDVVQDAFLALHQSLAKVPAVAFRVWLASVLRNRCRDIRRQRRTMLLGEHDVELERTDEIDAPEMEVPTRRCARCQLELPLVDFVPRGRSLVAYVCRSCCGLPTGRQRIAPLAEVERRCIERAMRICRTPEEAARRLGIGRATIYRRLRSYRQA